MFAPGVQPGTDGCIYFFLTSQPLRILYCDYRCTGFAGAKSEGSTYLKKKKLNLSLNDFPCSSSTPVKKVKISQRILVCGVFYFRHKTSYE